jgi:GNAT superfamily N-acetyltransferase
MDVVTREFDAARGDYEQLAQLAAVVDPTSSQTAASLRYRDETREPRVHLFRLVAETASGEVVAAGRVVHIWWAFHPRHFQLRIEVDPRWQRRGIGSTLFERLLTDLERCDAELVRAEARVGSPDAAAFLEHRGFVEWRRRWESLLEVANANTAPLVAAEQRVRDQGIVITTYADERTRRGDDLARAVYAADRLFASDDPTTRWDDGTEPMSFERFAAMQLDSPEALPDGHFLAMLDGQIVGLSRLNRGLRHPEVLHQDLTGTHPAFRGRGIAQALKLRTIEYAQAHGYREIRTSNDTSNGPMVHINDAIGFKRDEPTVIYERRLVAAGLGC